MMACSSFNLLVSLFPGYPLLPLYHSQVPVPAPDTVARYSSHSSGQPMARRSDLPTARNRTWNQAWSPLIIPVPAPVPVHARHGSRLLNRSPRPSPLLARLLFCLCLSLTVILRWPEPPGWAASSDETKNDKPQARPAAGKSRGILVVLRPPRSPKNLSSIISSLTPQFLSFFLACVNLHSFFLFLSPPHHQLLVAAAASRCCC